MLKKIFTTIKLHKGNKIEEVIEMSFIAWKIAISQAPLINRDFVSLSSLSLNKLNPDKEDPWKRKK